MTLSKYADKYFRIPAGTGGETGQWETLPYQRGIMDAISDPSIKYVTIQKSSRIGYTKMLTAYVQMCIHYEPRSILLVQPTDEDAEGYSKDEIAPLISEVAELRALVTDSSSTKTKNTIKEKRYPGGRLRIVAATSPKNFRRVYADVVIIDEWDGYAPNAGKEGDQGKLAEKRAQSSPFPKIIKGSTPTRLSTSRVVRGYRLSDQRRRYVPCPHCKHMQVLEFKNLKWDKVTDESGTVIEHKPETAAFMCVKCATLIEEKYKFEMDKKGEWRAEGKANGHAGFFIWTAYSTHPEARWRDIVSEFLEAKADPDPAKGKLIAFTNTVLGEPWDDSIELEGESMDGDYIRARANQADYEMGEVPGDVAVLLCTVDTQNGRLVVKVNGYGGDESWRIDRQILLGDPKCKPNEGVWAELDKYLATEFTHASGAKMKIRACAVDTGGGRTQYAYDFCAEQTHPCPVYAFKGDNKLEYPLVAFDRNGKAKWTLFKSKTNRRGRLFMVGVHQGRNQVHAELTVDAPGATGYMYFPRDWPQDAIDEQVAEVLVAQYRAGVEVNIWKKRAGRDNEEFDLEVYQRALFRLERLNLDLEHARLLEAAKAEGGPPATTPRRGGFEVIGGVDL